MQCCDTLNVEHPRLQVCEVAGLWAALSDEAVDTFGQSTWTVSGLGHTAGTGKRGWVQAAASKDTQQEYTEEHKLLQQGNLPTTMSCGRQDAAVAANTQQAQAWSCIRLNGKCMWLP